MLVTSSLCYVSSALYNSLVPLSSYPGNSYVNNCVACAACYLTQRQIFHHHLLPLQLHHHCYRHHYLRCCCYCLQLRRCYQVERRSPLEVAAAIAADSLALVNRLVQRALPGLVTVLPLAAGHQLLAITGLRCRAMVELPRLHLRPHLLHWPESRRWLDPSWLVHHLCRFQRGSLRPIPHSYRRPSKPPDIYV